MAGIGFKLQKMLHQEHGGGAAKAHLVAGALAFGPMIMTSIGVSLLAGLWMSGPENSLFRALVVHALAMVQILAGTVQLSVTRFLSDRLFEEDEEAILPTWIGSTLLVLALNLVGATILVSYWQLPLKTSLLFVLLSLILSALWNSTSFLSVIREYGTILWAYGLGLTGCLISSIWLYWDNDTNFSLLSLGLSLGLTLSLLVRRLWVELPLGTGIWDFLDSFSKYGRLILIGFAYNAGVWVDKWIFWYHPFTGHLLAPHLCDCPFYDGPVFAALLCILPAYAIFLLHTETSFYAAYRDYFGSINHRRPFREIHQNRLIMEKQVITNTRKLLLSQGFIALIFLVLPAIFPSLLSPFHTSLHIYQIMILSTMCNVLFLFVNVLLQYLDFLWVSAAYCTFYLVANALGTWLCIKYGGLAWYGFGAFVAALAALFGGWQVLRQRMLNLEFYTFMGSKSRL